MVEVWALDVDSGALGNRAEISGQRFMVLLAQSFVPLAQGLRNRASQRFPSLLGNRLSQSVRLWVFYVQADASFFTMVLPFFTLT
jgi:hypothetical protein